MQVFLLCVYMICCTSGMETDTAGLNGRVDFTAGGFHLQIQSGTWLRDENVTPFRKKDILGS